MDQIFVIVGKGIFILIVLVYWLVNLSCHPKGNSQQSSNNALSITDTVFKVDYLHPSFKQPVKTIDRAGKKKFVRITAKEIMNPNRIPLKFDLYWIVNNRTEFLGSVAPFPANHPGSFIVATAGKLVTDGELELRVVLPEEWTQNEQVEVSFKRLELE